MEQLMRDKMIIAGPMKELRIIVASLIEVQAKTNKKAHFLYFVVFWEKQFQVK